MWIVVALVAVIATSCNKDDDFIFGVAESTASSYEVEYQGDYIYVQMNTSAPYGINSNDSWCNVSEKKMTGFILLVDRNELLVGRSTQVEIYSEGFESIYLSVNQDAGVSFFEFGAPSSDLRLDQSGDDVDVVVDTNVEYVVTPVESWCTVTYTDDGFNIEADANSGSRRSCRVDIDLADESLFDSSFTIIQSGEAIVQNGCFSSGLDSWSVTTTIGTSLFSESSISTFNEATPDIYVGKMMLHNTNWAAEAEGYMEQEISSIDPGEYVLSIRANGTLGSIAKFQIILVNSDGSENALDIAHTSTALDTSSKVVAVTGSSCKIKIYLHQYADDKFWSQFTEIRLE